MSIDILPTIADLLGIEMPWEVDGVAAGDPDERRTDDVKIIERNGYNELRPEEGEDVVELDDTRPLFERVLATDLVEGTGPDGAWRRTSHGGLFGQDVAALDVGAPAGAEVSVRLLDDLEGADPARPLAEVVGGTSLPQGTVVAYALNGTVGAVTTVEPGLDGEPGLALGLLPPRLFQDGGNALEAFVVEGDVGAEVLRPVDVVPAA